MRRWSTLIIALAALATLAGIAATVATEVVMVPTSSERTQLIALLVSIAAVSITIAVVLRLFAPRSLTRRMLVAAISGPVVVAVALSAGSRSMFLSEHDLQFLLILLAFATVLGIGVMHALARPLTDDLAALTEVARRIGTGDLEVRAELERMDEVGDLASAIDSMAEQIASSRAARDEAERERSITLASLSHDARTPLTSMRLATEALLDGVAPDPERYLRTIASDITAVETLISDLFTIGQLEAGRLELSTSPIDVMTTVHDVVECMAPIAAEKTVQLMVTGPKRASLTADPSQLHRVLSNLVANAIRHSPSGAPICIEVDGSANRISVIDHGAGFPADFVDEAFQPFRRHDEARERAQGGAGLGLAVSKGIIEAHNGRIWADPGPGGAVHIELS
ncbi:MAG: HAMP domain-containing sensor histidine kinase [Acidimicrobiia bacterium]|nr:HAMP domain-containing sensor histidine kinase [Acidimicrobiia bacterium]